MKKNVGKIFWKKFFLKNFEKNLPWWNVAISTKSGAFFFVLVVLPKLNSTHDEISFNIFFFIEEFTV